MAYAIGICRTMRDYKRRTSRIGALVNLRLRDRHMPREKVEITALVRLPDMLGEHRPITALVARRRRRPCRLAARHLFVGYHQIDRARRDIDLDRIAGLHKGK